MQGLRHGLIASACLLVLPPAASAACTAPKGYEVVARSTAAVAFAEKLNTGRQAFVCSPQTGRRTYLENEPYVASTYPTRTYLAAAGGSTVAFPYDTEDGADYVGMGVAAVNARTGAVRDLEFIDYGSAANVARIVVTRNGGVAWTERRRTRQLQACLKACTRAGASHRTLSQGRGLDLRSLRVNGDDIYWRLSGVWHSRRLG